MPLRKPIQDLRPVVPARLRRDHSATDRAAQRSKSLVFLLTDQNKPVLLPCTEPAHSEGMVFVAGFFTSSDWSMQVLHDLQSNHHDHDKQDKRRPWMPVSFLGFGNRSPCMAVIPRASGNDGREVTRYCTFNVTSSSTNDVWYSASSVPVNFNVIDFPM